jgi:hypothetical protein
MFVIEIVVAQGDFPSVGLVEMTSQGGRDDTQRGA